MKYITAYKDLYLSHKPLDRCTDHLHGLQPDVRHLNFAPKGLPLKALEFLSGA